MLCLLLFSAVGRFSHGFPVLDFETLKTADPFIAGLFYLSFFCCDWCSEDCKCLMCFSTCTVDRMVLGCLLPWRLWG